MTDALVQAEALLSLQQRFRIARARSQRLLKDYDEGKHPRDEHGRWTDGGGGSDSSTSAARPQATQGAGASDKAFAKIKAAVDAIPPGHAAQIDHVPVVLTKTSDDFPSHIAAGGGASTVGLFSWTNDKPRIDVAEAIKATTTQAAPQGQPQSAQTETLLPVRQPEQVTVHELAHAFDYVNGWKPSAHPDLNQSFADAIKQMTETEAKNANYWISGGQREMFAELYSALYNPNRSSDQTYFGGMTHQRVEQVFAPAIAHVLQIKRFRFFRRATAPPTGEQTGWFVNSDGRLYALINGMPYEVDVAGTPFEKLKLVPGTYADADALVTAAKQKSWQLARDQARELLTKFDPSEPRDDAGKWTDGGGGSEGTSKPSGGKDKKSSKKEDFDKAKVTLPPDKVAQDAFIEKWNDKVGVDPATFKTNFMGGLDGKMRLSATGNQINVNGAIQDSDGDELGTFERNIDLDRKSAYSAYFKLNKSETKSGIGKKMLAGNIETYKQLGIEKVTVSANIDVGGYAWAKYGYLPTQASWNTLRSDLEDKLGGRSSSSSSRPSSANTIEADDWGMLSSDRQDDVRDRWMRDSRDEFISSEEQNWREFGQAKDDAKRELADEFTNYQVAVGDVPAWIDEALDGARQYFEDRDQPPIPYSNRQLYDAIELKYESNRGDGEDDPDIDFDDKMLQEPEGYDPNQQTLPGIEPVEPHEQLTKAMRDRIGKRIIAAFDKKAEENAGDLDPPSYLADSVAEYQDEYWDQKSDSEKLRHAIDYGMADIEIEPDEDEEAPQAEMELPEPATAGDTLLDAVHSSDPKSIWKIADSPQGKSLLLNTSWSGVLNLKNKEQMDRFDKYVGRAK